MSIFKCKMCGGTIEFNVGDTIGICDSCGTKQTLPRLDSDRKTNLYDRANHFRRNNEFDKAMSIYENILNEDPTDSEAYWSLVLCRYGIEYVEDPATHKRIPTVNRAQFTSIFDDEDYKSAIQNADMLQRAIYEDEAKAINEIQRGILEISEKEEPFDVFICYKETDANGRRTPDSVLATELYHQLTQEGFKVFFSRITLEDKLGTAYEPYIFAALNSAKVMVVLGTKPEYFNAVWVKNEWSRYLSLIKMGGRKTLIPAYRDMDPYDLPEEFSHLQAQDMSKLGFMQDLIRGIRKIIDVDRPKPVGRETVVINTGNANAAPLLRRAFMFLEDKEWNKADDFCEQVLNIDPENAEAYLGKLMAELHISTREGLKDQPEPFDTLGNYRKAMRFGDDKLKSELSRTIDQINTRIENERLTGIYNKAKNEMDSAATEDGFKSAAAIFQTIPGFKDADKFFDNCLKKAEACRKDSIYFSAKTKMQEEDITSIESAIKIFQTIPGWKDTEELIQVCRRKIKKIKEDEETSRIVHERLAEMERLTAEKTAKTKKKITILITSVIVACVWFVVLYNSFIVPNSKYKTAMQYYETGRYEEAITVLQGLKGYKDSTNKITVCQNAIKDRDYKKAAELFKAGEYEEAITIFQRLNEYEDSKKLVEECLLSIKDRDYKKATELFMADKYEEALAVYIVLDGYMDSAEQIEACQAALKELEYNAALKLYHDGQYEEAYPALTSLEGYKDSGMLAAEIKPLYNKARLRKSEAGSVIIFGSFEQDNRVDNGKEDIEWIVLIKEEQRVFVISKYALDCQKYHSEDKSIAWETCSLREWLNSYFLDNAFSAEEQSLIPEVTVKADKNPEYSTDSGKDTKDKVFLLSSNEAKKYLNENDVLCAPTAYAIIQGAATSNYTTESGRKTCWWWLRSSGYRSWYAAVGSCSGSIDNRGQHVNYDLYAVRPALWIDLEP